MIEATVDARLIAVDAATGRPCANFGINGQVDAKIGLGRVCPGMASITAPTTIVRGVIVTGRQVLDNERNDAPSGVIQAYDAITGKPKWAWDLGRPGQIGRPKPRGQFTRGTPNMWTTAAADEQLDLVYVPTGNSASDYWSTDRSPQETPSTARSARSMRPRESRFGTSRPCTRTSGITISAASRRWWTYWTARRRSWSLRSRGISTCSTGAPASRSMTSRNVPCRKGGEEPQQRSPTQPLSLFSNLRHPDLKDRAMWGISPIDQMICRIQYRKAE